MIKSSLSFSKYSACGNDFILIDHRIPFFDFNSGAIQKLCDRKTGIGADGIIFLEPSLKANFKMRIFNLDGSEAEMCGNGIRCLAKFLEHLSMTQKKYSIETMHRLLIIEWENDLIKVEMGNPTDTKLQFQIEGIPDTLHFINTGVPHTVIFIEKNLDSLDVNFQGEIIRNHPFFSPKGTNVNFVEVIGKNEITIRTFERGVEAETQACGTGATAAGIVSFLIKNMRPPIKVKTKSQDILTINFKIDEKNCISNVTQTGPATKIFNGII